MLSFIGSHVSMRRYIFLLSLTTISLKRSLLIFIIKVFRTIVFIFSESSRVQQTPEEGRRTYRPKRWGNNNNNKDEDNSPKNLNDKNHNICSIILFSTILDNKVPENRNFWGFFLLFMVGVYTIFQIRYSIVFAYFTMNIMSYFIIPFFIFYWC